MFMTLFRNKKSASNEADFLFEKGVFDFLKQLQLLSNRRGRLLFFAKKNLNISELFVGDA